MNLNAYISGFDSTNQLNAILSLEKESYINIKEWLVDSHTSVTHNTSKWWWDIVLSEKFKNECFISEDDIKFIEYNKRDFFQHLVREILFERSSIFDLDHAVFKLFLYFKNCLLNNDIKVVLFSDIPHGAYNYILYLTAKHLSIKTLFMFSSFWEDTSYICENISDIGEFDILSNSEYPIKKEFEKDLPYMVIESRWRKFQRKLKDAFNIQKLSSKIQHRQRRYFMYRKYIGHYLLLNICRNIDRYRNTLLYKKSCELHLSRNFDITQNFVYFALHLQPEMTTDTLGGRYYDQCLAIKLLRQMIPDNWIIAVKENPKQTWYMRSPEFFNRLSSIPNLIFLDRSINTYDLIRHSKFVATNSGTVGWDAITGGKQALVFGTAWYRKFPGVCTYRENLTVQDILSKKIDHKLICQCAQNLRNTGYLFTANIDIINRKKNFDTKNNLVSMKRAWIDKLKRVFISYD